MTQLWSQRKLVSFVGPLDIVLLTELSDCKWYMDVIAQHTLKPGSLAVGTGTSADKGRGSLPGIAIRKP